MSKQTYPSTSIKVWTVESWEIVKILRVCYFNLHLPIRFSDITPVITLIHEIFSEILSWFCVKLPFWAPSAAVIVKPLDINTACSNTHQKQNIRHLEGVNEEQDDSCLRGYLQDDWALVCIRSVLWSGAFFFSVWGSTTAQNLVLHHLFWWHFMFSWLWLLRLCKRCSCQSERKNSHLGFSICVWKNNVPAGNVGMGLYHWGHWTQQPVVGVFFQTSVE